MKCVTCGTPFDAECAGAPLRPWCSCSVTEYRSSMFMESDASGIVDLAFIAADEYKPHQRHGFLQRVVDLIYEELAK